jgi:hypothetical protein
MLDLHLCYKPGKSAYIGDKKQTFIFHSPKIRVKQARVLAQWKE